MDQNEISEDVLVVKESSVHGDGLFTTIALKPNDVIPLENNTIKLIDIKQEMSKDVHKKFLDLMTENPNEEFLDAWFLIFISYLLNQSQNGLENCIEIHH